MKDVQDIKGTNNKKVKLSKHTEVDRAVWFAICLQYASEDLNTTVKDLGRKLLENGIAKWLLDGYDVFHTQGYAYMTEMIVEKVKEDLKE